MLARAVDSCLIRGIERGDRGLRVRGGRQAGRGDMESGRAEGRRGQLVMLIASRSFAVLLMPTWKVRPADALPSSRFLTVEVGHRADPVDLARELRELGLDIPALGRASVALDDSTASWRMRDTMSACCSCRLCEPATSRHVVVCESPGEAGDVRLQVGADAEARGVIGRAVDPHTGRQATDRGERRGR